MERKPIEYDRLLRTVLAADYPDNRIYENLRPYKRRVKIITKGDPREFIG